MQSSYSLRTGIYPEIDPDRLTGSLSGKNVLITGSGRGIGREIALSMARAGANVCVTARTSSQVEETKTDIVKLGLDAKVIGIVADVLKLADQERLVHEFREQLGPIDVLVCNAGSNIFQPFHLTNATEWWDIMELNVRAPVELTRLVLPEMRERNQAVIIYTSSWAAKADLPWTTAYNCAKTSITRFAGTLQVELDQLQKIEKGLDNKITVFSIHPGEIETNLHETSFPEKTKRKAPYVMEHMAKIGAKRPHFEAALPAWTCVWLSSGKGWPLRGKFVDCTRDVGEQAKDALETAKV
ncbi:peroxisomal short-chain alcohol dehydrogenase [Fusarium beomiforme]|uniref:Peroxisomal short-chain alcohol dehydrogenase n=1 Tax=Fusarium beomiforme TaxID=44412 RepID=A0A9P5AM34_9HYPO|nr:peroxisomal short-chain alcohol dehydrogenase [Fusarium beomiforme]